MVKAIYAFSGDPITYGHIDIIERAARVFDDVVVGIGVNPDKAYLFSLQEREEMARRSLVKFDNVRVVSFQGLLVDYAYENAIPIVVRGVRDNGDFEYELSLHRMGQSQNLGIDTFFLPARRELIHVSSSAVKAMQKEHGIIHEYVPLYVKQCLEAKISGQYFIGVTGEIGVEKFMAYESFRVLAAERGIPVYQIRLDDIHARIWEELDEPIYRRVRERVVEAFGERVRKRDGYISRKALGELVFNDYDNLRTLNRLMYNPLMVRLRREVYDKRGLILLNSGLIAESAMTYLCNNNVILIEADKSTRVERLRGRGLSERQIARRIHSQMTAKKKKDLIEAKIAQDKQGHLWCVDHSGGADPAQFARIFEDVVARLDVRVPGEKEK